MTLVRKQEIDTEKCLPYSVWWDCPPAFCPWRAPFIRQVGGRFGKGERRRGCVQRTETTDRDDWQASYEIARRKQRDWHAKVATPFQNTFYFSSSDALSSFFWPPVVSDSGYQQQEKLSGNFLVFRIISHFCNRRPYDSGIIGFGFRLPGIRWDALWPKHKPHYRKPRTTVTMAHNQLFFPFLGVGQWQLWSTVPINPFSGMPLFNNQYTWQKRPRRSLLN